MLRNLRALFVAIALGSSAAAAGSTFELPAAETVDGLIARGRELLRAGSAADAQEAFDRAAALDGASPLSRVWVIRGWIASGRLDEALLAVDELAAAGAREADVDYLFALAFFAQAKRAIAEGGGGPYTEGQLEDSFRMLSRAMASDAERYRDAWLALAEAGWYVSALEEARAAVERGIELDPQSPAAHALLGRIAFSQFAAAGGPSDTVGQEAHWTEALRAFEDAIELYGEPGDPKSRTALADAHVQCGHLHAWRKDAASASASYAAAMGWDPSRVDFAQVRTALGRDAFGSCVADGLARFGEAHGPDDARLATLLWWQGAIRFEGSDWKGAEGAFRRAIELWPAYTNAWYYLFRACLVQGEHAEAIEALRRHLAAAPDELVAALAAERGADASRIDRLVAWCADPGLHGGSPSDEDAAFLCELLTRVEPGVSRHWNNLGLFLRDRGDRLRSEPRGADPAALQDLWERAHAAYCRALELEPENPNYLNDTAVMLHYYLERDLDRAMAMYEHAARSAERELARDDLAPDVREVVQIALRDSRDNIRRLGAYLEKHAVGQAVDPLTIR